MASDTDRPLRVLVVGAGMYTCGRGTDGFGTVLPALFEAGREGQVGAVTVVGRDPANRQFVLGQAARLSEVMRCSVPVEYLPSSGPVRDDVYLTGTAEAFDCAIIAVPDQLHFDVTSALIERGLHCLVVKPVVAVLAQLQELIRLRDVHGVYCAVEFHKRFDEANLELRRRIRSGVIGDIVYVLVEFSQRRTVPLGFFRSWCEATNVFQYLGVHYVDMVHFCTGAIPTRAVASGQRSLLSGQGVKTLDAVQALVEWKDEAGGAPFTLAIVTSWIDPSTTSAMSQQGITFVGTKGRLESDQKDRGMRQVVEGAGPEHLNPYFSTLQEGIDGSLRHVGYGSRSIRQFLADCRGLRRGSTSVRELHGLRPTLEEARAATAVLEAVNRSLAADGGWIAIDPRGTGESAP